MYEGISVPSPHLPPPLPSHPLLFPSLEVGPLNPARGSGPWGSAVSKRFWLHFELRNGFFDRKFKEILAEQNDNFASFVCELGKACDAVRHLIVLWSPL